MTRSTCCFALWIALVMLLPVSAAAQTIAGTVTDASGSVLPGVTVEASSAALIEQTRSVITNDAGRFSIVNLRPGTYTVTFTLSGFRTVRREGIELTSDFTANVNAELGVGGVEEVITVAAVAPVVDVQSVAAPRVYTRDMLDALPTGRTPAAILNTIPGTSPGFFATNFRGTSDSVTMVDGMRASNLIGAGPSLTTAPSSSSMYQEYSFSTQHRQRRGRAVGDPHQPDSQGWRQPAARLDLQYLHAGQLAIEQRRRLPAVTGTHRAGQDTQAVGFQPERRRPHSPRSSVVPDDLSEQR